MAAELIGMKGINMEEEPKNYTIQEYILFKLDRTIAICGLILIAFLTMWAGFKLGVVGKELPETVSNILTLVVNGLCFYLGVRLGSK